MSCVSTDSNPSLSWLSHPLSLPLLHFNSKAQWPYPSLLSFTHFWMGILLPLLNGTTLQEPVASFEVIDGVYINKLDKFVAVGG